MCNYTLADLLEHSLSVQGPWVKPWTRMGLPLFKIIKKVEIKFALRTLSHNKNKIYYISAM